MSCIRSSVTSPGQVFTFRGDDDVFAFINDQLVIDLGGVHGPITASVALDSLELTPGSVYPLDLFFAERQTSGSSFRVDTSIQLTTLPDLAVESVVQSVNGDWQALQAEGDATATITNLGEGVASGPIEVTFFEDRNFNGAFEPTVDQVFDQRDIPVLLPGESIEVIGQIDGSVLFRRQFDSRICR